MACPGVPPWAPAGDDESDGRGSSALLTSLPAVGLTPVGELDGLPGGWPGPNGIRLRSGRIRLRSSQAGAAVTSIGAGCCLLGFFFFSFGCHLESGRMDFRA